MQWELSSSYFTDQACGSTYQPEGGMGDLADVHAARLFLTLILQHCQAVAYWVSAFMHSRTAYIIRQCTCADLLWVLHVGGMHSVISRKLENPHTVFKGHCIVL